MANDIENRKLFLCSKLLQVYCRLCLVRQFWKLPEKLETSRRRISSPKVNVLGLQFCCIPGSEGKGQLRGQQDAMKCEQNLVVEIHPMPVNGDLPVAQPSHLPQLALAKGIRAPFCRHWVICSLGKGFLFLVVLSWPDHTDRTAQPMPEMALKFRKWISCSYMSVFLTFRPVVSASCHYMRVIKILSSIPDFQAPKLPVLHSNSDGRVCCKTCHLNVLFLDNVCLRLCINNNNKDDDDFLK